MTLFRRGGFLVVCAAAAVAAAITLLAGCQATSGSNYPEKPIELIVRFGTGGGADIMYRKLASIVEKQNPRYKFAIVNLAGSNGFKAVDSFMGKPADGYTLLNTDATIPLGEALGETKFKLEDYIHLIRVTDDTIVLSARPDDNRFKTVQDMIAYGKANPGKMSIATTGAMSSFELACRYWGYLAGYDAKYVPYDQPGERHASALGGHVDILAEHISTVNAMIQDKKLRPLVFLSLTKIERYKDVPVSKDVGIDFGWGQVRGFAVRTGTPANIAADLEKVFKQAVDSQEYKDYEKEQLLDLKPGYLSSADWKKHLENERTRFTEIIKTLNIKTSN